MKLGHVALDGTKVRANSSKHKAMSYGRMKEKGKQLASEVAELLWVGGEVSERFFIDPLHSKPFVHPKSLTRTVSIPSAPYVGCN